MISTDNVVELIQHGQESNWLDFKASVYRKEQYKDLLKDIMSMANSEYLGSKFIIVGIKLHPNGTRELTGIGDALVDDAQFQQLVLSNIEPDIKFTFYPIKYAENLFGIFEISKETNDRPYLMKKSFNKELKAGECWIRKGSQQTSASRQDYDEIYYKQHRLRVKIMDGYLLGGLDDKGNSYGRLLVQFTNFSSKIPMTLINGNLTLFNVDGKEVTYHPVYGFENENKGTDYHLYIAPSSELTGELIVGFGSAHSISLGLDEYGHTDTVFNMHLEFTDSNGQIVNASYEPATVHAQGDSLLWKVQRSTQY